MKNILYYVEPWVELSPDFRFGAFQEAVYQLHLLKAHSPELDCRLLVGDGVREAAERANFNEHRELPTGVLYLADLQRVFVDSADAAHAFLNDTATEEQLESLARLAKRALGDFVPDVILMHETHAPYLTRAFPNALRLHGMYGMTYRMPFPRLSLLDPEGLYQRSTLVRHLAEIARTPLSREDRKTLADIRNWFAAQIVPHDPVWPHIEPDQTRFDRLLLVPLQVDGYFAFRECCPFKNQTHFLTTVLDKTPKSWGVVVTEHSEYKPALDELTVERLRRLYPNFIYKREINAIPYSSQALLAHVDAVVSVSSSIAFQALIYDCPVVAAGNSHINAAATCDLDNLHRVFDLHAPGRRDSILHFLLTRYHHITARHVQSGPGLYALLRQFFDAHQAGAEGLDRLPEPARLDAVFEALKSVSQWRAWKETLASKKIAVSPHPVLSRLVFADAVSFDLFDTLVDRPFVHPHELFQFIEPLVRERTGNIYFPFHHLRREAERKAREATGHRIEVTLDEIYEQLELITGFPRSLLVDIKELEIQSELSLIGPRRGVVRAWRHAGTLGKLRSILTDIYLEEHVIRRILDRHGLSDFDLLFVSATERIRKDDGTIYPHYRSEVQRIAPKASAFLHVGDNPRADGEMARRFGIETVVIPSAMDQLKGTELGRHFAQALNTPSFDSSMVVGLVANRFFSAPTSSRAPNGLCDGHLFDVGYTLLGPFVLGYVQWVIRRMRAHRIDHAYFLARDGYLVMKVYESLKKVTPNLPSHSYLYCSRRGVMVPGIWSDKDIYEIATLNFGTTTLKSFLASRYGLEVDQVPTDVLRKHGFDKDGKTLIGYPRDLAAVVRFVTDIRALILSNAESERSTFMKYLRKEGVTDRERKSAFVDIGYSGTMQRKISELTGAKHCGYYMLTHNYVLHHFRDEVFEAWLEEFDSQRAPYRHPFNDYIPLIESLLSSQEGSFVKFHDSDGELAPEYLYASNERERCAFVDGLHSGALAFVDDFIDRFGRWSGEFELSPQVSSFGLFRFGERPTEHDIRVFEGLILENMFAGAEFPVIADPAPLLDRKGLLSANAFDHLVARSKWKQGARAAYQRYMPAGGPASPARPASTVQPAPVHVAAAQGGLTPARKKEEIEADRKFRLRRKLKNDPERFFADSRSKLRRPLRHLFGNHFMGDTLKYAVRKLF